MIEKLNRISGGTLGFILASKTLNTVHILAGGFVSILAFYYLGQEMLIGWVFQSCAGFLYTLYFWRHSLPMMATVIFGAEAVLPIYGLYKWTTSLNLFTSVDTVILGITTLFVLYIAYGMFTDKSNSLLLTSVEFANALLYIIAIIILSITQSVLAWWVFIVVFILTLILVVERKEWIAVAFQIAYVGLAILAILNGS